VGILHISLPVEAPKPIQKPEASPALPEKDPAAQRNRREVIRFPSVEERRKALQVLMDLREQHQFSVYQDPNEWWLYTVTLRKLKERGVLFQWLTENI
jgi:hypothetical protein